MGPTSSKYGWLNTESSAERSDTSLFRIQVTKSIVENIFKPKLLYNKKVSGPPALLPYDNEVSGPFGISNLDPGESSTSNEVYQTPYAGMPRERAAAYSPAYNGTV